MKQVAVYILTIRCNDNVEGDRELTKDFRSGVEGAFLGLVSDKSEAPIAAAYSGHGVIRVFRTAALERTWVARAGDAPLRWRTVGPVLAVLAVRLARLCRHTRSPPEVPGNPDRLDNSIRLANGLDPPRSSATPRMSPLRPKEVRYRTNGNFCF